MIRVLIVDDDPTVAHLVQEELDAQCCETEAVVSVPAAMRRLDEAPFDIVVLDRDDATHVERLLDAHQLKSGCGFVVLRPKPWPRWMSPSLLPPANQRAHAVAAAVVTTAQQLIEISRKFDGKLFWRHPS